MSTTAAVSRAMTWSVLAKASRFVLAMVSSVLVVRSLGEDDYGVLSLVRTFLLVVLLSGAGFRQALLKFLPDLRQKSSRGGTLLLVRQVVTANVIMWLAMLATAWFLRGWLSGVFNAESVGIFVVAGVAMAIFEIVFTFVAQILNAGFDTKRLSIAHVIAHAIYIAGLIVAMPRGGGILAVLAAAALGNLVATVIVWPALHAVIPSGSGDRTATIDNRRLMRFAIPFTAIGVLNMIVWRQSETFFLAHYRTAAETGFFDLAYRLPQMILEFIPGTVWPIVMAGFSEVYARDARNLQPAIDRYYRMLFVMTAPICVTGAVLGGVVIRVLYGDAMAPAALPTQLFFVIFTLSFFSTPLSMALYVTERTHVNLLVYLGLAVINVGLDIVLIPKYGVLGAMIPVGLVIALTPLIYYLIVRRLVDDLRIPYRFIGKCFLASTGVLALIPLLRWVTGPATLAAAGLVAAILVVFGFKFARVFGEEERAIIESLPLPFAERIMRFIGS